MRRRGPVGERGVATVLFTDIGGSTELASKLGDRRWRELLKAHHAVVRRELRRHGGREVDTAGDGFFALFDQPARAVRCALGICDGVERIGLKVRAGVHTGEIEPMDENVGGIGVHIGARVASQAAPGEVVVSGTVRDLMAGSDVGFTDRGLAQLKGVPGEWRLFTVERAPSEPEPELAVPGTPEPRKRRRKVLIAGGLTLAAIVTAVTIALSGSSQSLGPNAVVRVGESGTQRSVALTDPTGVAVGGDSVWAISLQDQVLYRAPRSGGAATSRGLPGKPTGVAYGAGSVWITTQFGQTGVVGPLTRLTLTPSGFRTESVRMAQGASALVFARDGIWVANPVTDEVVHVDPTSNEAAVPIEIQGVPVAIAAGAHAIWVVTEVNGILHRIDPSTRKVQDIALPGGLKPSGVAADDTGVWVIAKNSDRAVRLDAASGGVVKVLTINRPAAVAIVRGEAWIGSGNSVLRFDGTFRLRSTTTFGGPVTSLMTDGDSVWAAVGGA